MKYNSEVKERWGNTQAYSEYAEKSKGYTKEKYGSLAESLNGIFKELADLMKSGMTAECDEVQRLVKKLQSHITENYYTCTKEILAGLGQMYTLDERFRNNIDKNGVGTAEFASKAIAVYCK